MAGPSRGTQIRYLAKVEQKIRTELAAKVAADLRAAEEDARVRNIDQILKSLEGRR